MDVAATDITVFAEQELYRLEAIAGAVSVAVLRIRETRGAATPRLKGWTDLRPLQSAVVSDRVEFKQESPRQATLPPRAGAVARLLCEGKTNKTIAAALGLSPFTVRDHVKHLCRRFDAANRTELVRRLIADA